MSSKQSLILNNRNFYCHFHLGPFDSGQGLTIANALRRTLLSELNGLAITAVEIEGVMHEYTNLIGVKETVLDILLNIKEIVMKSNYRLNLSDAVGFLQVRGPGIIRACDIKLPSYLLCVDPQQYIATLAEDGILNMKFHISRFDLNKEKKQNQTSIKATNLLMVDPVFCCVTKVNYIIEQNLSDISTEFIILEIWTNGSIHPREALNNAFKKLVNIFYNLRKFKLFESSLKSNQTYTKLSNGLINRRFIETYDLLGESRDVFKTNEFFEKSAVISDLNFAKKNKKNIDILQAPIQASLESKSIDSNSNQIRNYSVPFSLFDSYSLLNKKKELEYNFSKNEEKKKNSQGLKSSTIRSVTKAAQLLDKKKKKTSLNKTQISPQRSRNHFIKLGSFNDSMSTVDEKKQTLIDFLHQRFPKTKINEVIKRRKTNGSKLNKVSSFSFISLLPSDNIEFLNFSLKTFCILKDAEIHKIEDLLKMPIDKLLTNQKFGKRTLLEIKNKLNDIILTSL